MTRCECGQTDADAGPSAREPGVFVRPRVFVCACAGAQVFRCAVAYCFCRRVDVCMLCLYSFAVVICACCALGNTTRSSAVVQPSFSRCRRPSSGSAAQVPVSPLDHSYLYPTENSVESVETHGPGTESGRNSPLADTDDTDIDNDDIW